MRNYEPKRIKTIYIVAPWHPQHGPALAAEIVELSQQWRDTLRALMKEETQLRVVWSNAGRPLFAKLRAVDGSNNGVEKSGGGGCSFFLSR